MALVFICLSASARTPVRPVNKDTAVLQSIENVKKRLGYADGTTRTSQVALPQQTGKLIDIL